MFSRCLNALKKHPQALLSSLNVFLSIALLRAHACRLFPAMLAIPLRFRVPHRSLASATLLTIPEHDLVEKCSNVLERAGCSPQSAKAVASSIVAAQRDGKYAHGLARLPAIVTSLQTGVVNGYARPRHSMRAPGQLWVDADGGFVHGALPTALAALAEMAREVGVASLSITNCRGIIGALWIPLEALAQAWHSHCLSFLCAAPWEIIPSFMNSCVIASSKAIAYADMCMSLLLGAWSRRPRMVQFSRIRRSCGRSVSIIWHKSAGNGVAAKRCHPSALDAFMEAYSIYASPLILSNRFQALRH